MPWCLSGGPFDGHAPIPFRLMKTHDAVAPRIATIEAHDVRREGRAHHHTSRIGAAVAGAVLAIGLAACSPGASTVPLPSLGAVPSVDVSAAASVASQAALASLDQVDAAITANTSSTGLSADDANSLKQLTTGIRTSLQSGDTTSAKSAADNLATKVDSLAAKLNTDAGKQLKDALAALKTALASS
jgi:hypothetical protein